MYGDGCEVRLWGLGWAFKSDFLFCNNCPLSFLKYLGSLEARLQAIEFVKKLHS